MASSADPVPWRDLARLGLLAGYSLALLAENTLHFEGRAVLALSITTVLLWLALVVDYVRRLVRATNRRAEFRHLIGYPIVLLTLPLVISHQPWLVAIPLVIGFVLQLRQITAGHALTFALALASFVAVLATAGVVYAEQSEPESNLRDWGTAASWSVSILLHLRGYDPGKPLSEDGIALSFVLSVTGFLVAALLTAQIVSWVIGDKRRTDAATHEPKPDAPTERSPA